MSSHPQVISQDTLSRIAEAIQGIQFGFVQITVHNARVVQIEATQKIRLDHQAHLIPDGLPNHLSFADQTAGGKRPLVEQNGHASGDGIPQH